MNRLEELEQLAFDEGIGVYNEKFNINKKGIALSDEEYKAIFLNSEKIESYVDEKCVLAEELGHHMMNAMLPCDEQFKSRFNWLNQKCEIQATRWAIKKLLPIEKLKQSLSNEWYSCDYEIAEELSVTVELLLNAIEFYKTKGMLR